ncbi:hypothetical protein HK103_007438 [Boothiomyces macroporosus]|uniref:Protein kinase domain-containing protein n=1 Tax=Boothiomyces macroporosus TaxID=261099 RepID=A0AAD5UKY9_9FUNG|nr:hypothetical protein HK103_007438 [Boothiomyces macroporosus]
MNPPPLPPRGPPLPERKELPRIPTEKKLPRVPTESRNKENTIINVIQENTKNVKNLLQRVGSKIKKEISNERYDGLTGIALAEKVFEYRPFQASATINLEKEYTFYTNHKGIYYEKVCDLGSGANGTVSKARCLNTNEIVALKRLNHYQDHKDAMREQKIHEMMGTSAGEVLLSATRDFIVMKYIEGRTLEKELLDPESKHDPLQLYMKCKSLILKLYSFGYYHGDTNSGNFVVTDDDVYLIDYGESYPCTMLESILYDFKKLASNVIDEIQYRQTEEADECKKEALLDYKDPERNVSHLRY